LGSIDGEPDQQIDLIGDVGLATIFISDIHAGDGKSGCLDFVEFLRVQTDIQKVVLVGDICDLWVASAGKALSAVAPLFKLLNEKYSGNVRYIIGNHDQDLVSLKEVFPFVHTSLRFPINNKQAIVLHGHVLDENPYLKTKFSHYMAWFINKFDGWAKIDTRKSLVSLSERIKNDPYDKVLKDYEDKICSMAKGRFDYVIVGHSHIPSLKTIDGITIINCGDSLQHRTLVKADQRGFYLIDYVKQQIITEFLFRNDNSSTKV
jgi:UDP-2,3-diacylglucosamine hydrolase